jgi:hypothetical protein
MARIERTASFMDRVLPVLRDRLSGQPDLLGRVHGMPSVSRGRAGSNVMLRMAFLP